MGKSNKFLGFSQLIVFTVVIFKYSSFSSWDTLLWIKDCRKDFEYCPQCFITNNMSLGNWHKYIKSFKNELATNINSIFGKRKIQRAIWMSREGRSINVILKHISSDVLEYLENTLCQYVKSTQNMPNCANIWQLGLSPNELSQILSFMYRNKSRNIICPAYESNEFLLTFNHFSSDSLFWMQLWANPELVILKAIHSSNNSVLKNAVPEVIDWCGFVILEQDTGPDTLADFYDSPLSHRIYLARQLLEIAIAFSHGLNGFRIYLTDSTPDNIVVDRSTLQVTFVDLDSLLIVNSYIIRTNIVHRYEQIECDNCFAFIPEEICSHQLSDLNLFCICQIFLANSLGKGLLHSIPPYIDHLFSLSHLLDQCVNCDKYVNCSNRFHVANSIVSTFTKIQNISDKNKK